MDYTIRPAYSPMKKILGTAFTVKVPPGDNMMVKKALHLAKPGDVIVVDSRGHTDWCLGGGGMIVMAKQRGIAGAVLDGCYRDIEQIQNIDFPMFLKGVHPSTGPKRGPGELNVPICCGGVIVHPGDIVYGDREGVVVVPKQYAQMIVDKVSKVPVKKLASDWDWDGIVESDKPRDDYFDEVLAARGVEIIEKA
jgi:regulator of RNase E activity RraA